jgi:serine phosphatase RsbU (regulator of sigma subunit)
VSGDYYDVYNLPDGRFACIADGDESGKGVRRRLVP